VSLRTQSYDTEQAGGHEAGGRLIGRSVFFGLASKKWTRTDRSFSSLVVSLFEGHRGNTAERAVTPRSVVERLDVIEDGKFSGRP